MLEVNFYESTEDSFLKFVVIAARYHGKWIFCRQRGRNTWEMPGGHREPGEAILDSAGRELYEETGAVDYDLHQIGVYLVTDNDGDKNNQNYGMMYYAEVNKLGGLPDYEMEQVILMDNMPEPLTYPLIQPALYERVIKYLRESKNTEKNQKP